MHKITVDWSRMRDKADLKPAMARFTRYLERLGLKENTIKLYARLINTYLAEVNTIPPPKIMQISFIILFTTKTYPAVASIISRQY
jgi:hypothetical protein